MKFDRYIGIDWSGAEDEEAEGLEGIAIAVYDKRKGLRLISRRNRRWSRQDVYNTICGIINHNESTLIGIDFAFSFPWYFRKAYFPGHQQNPADKNKLWDIIEQICKIKNFYGGNFYIKNNNYTPLFYSYIQRGYHKGSEYQGRYRVTEIVARERYNTKPASVFKFVGSDQVGPGSIAGMRMLYKLREDFPDCPIWPFDIDWINNGYKGPVIIEIYPGLFHKQAGTKIDKKQTRAIIILAYQILIMH